MYIRALWFSFVLKVKNRNAQYNNSKHLRNIMFENNPQTLVSINVCISVLFAEVCSHMTKLLFHKEFGRAGCLPMVICGSAGVGVGIP